MYLIPPNLAAMGVKRRTVPGIPDLIIPWETPYPMHSAYLAFCAEAGLTPYGGGTREQQGSVIPGYIASGYRDEVLEGNATSPHLYGFAFDPLIGDLIQQVEKAKIAVKYFSRVGLYPGNRIIHVDQAPDNWIERYNKARSWVRVDEVYHSFPNLHGSLIWLKENVDGSIEP